MRTKGVVLRLATLVVIVATVVAVATAAGALVRTQGGTTVDAPPPHPEYAADTLDPEPIPATGSVLNELRTNGSGERNERVLIDLGHQNRIDREDIQPLVGALVARGHEVRFLEAGEDIGGDLEAADAFVVIDPAKPYRGSEADRVRSFTANGGRVLLVGEPNRKDLNIGLFGATIDTQRSHITGLAGRFGISFGTTYLHDMERNDGTYKQVVVEPAAGADLPGVNRVVVDTAAPVSAPDGDPVLRTPPTTNRSGVDGGAAYPVAVRTDDVMAVGDATLFRADNVRIADNEAFVAATIRFLLRGDKQPRTGPGGGGNTTGTATPTGP